MAIHSSILAWEIPWTEEPGRLQSIRSQRVRHNWRNLEHTQTRLEIKRCGEVSWKRKLGIGPENILPWSYSVHRKGLYVSSSWGWVKVQGSGKVEKLNPSLINNHFVLISRKNQFSSPFFFFFYLMFIYLAALGLSCSIWDLVPWSGIKPRPSALGVQSLSHWTTKEVPV